MIEVSLGEILKPARTVRAGSRDLPILSMTMRHGLVDQAEKFKKDVASRDRSQYKVITREQLVIGFPIDEGVLAFQDIYDEAIVSPAYGVWDVEGDGVHRPYLQKFLRSSRAIEYYKARLQGTTARRRSLPNPVFLELRVPLPPLPEQRRVAAILDQADALRVKRRETIDRLGECARAYFSELFDDTRPGDQVITLASLGVKFTSGLNVVAQVDEHPENRVLKVSSVSGGSFDCTQTKPMPLDYLPPTSHVVRSGDLLVTRASGSVDLICVPSIVRDIAPNTYLPDKIWKVEPGLLTKDFIRYVFQTPEFRAYIRNNSSGASGVRNISQKRVLEYQVGKPSPASLTEFGRFLISHDLAVENRNHSLRVLNSLYHALQSRAFRGDL